jgi:hypothetical protein
MRWIGWLVLLAAAPAVADDRMLALHASGDIGNDALDRAWPELVRCLAPGHVAGHLVVKHGKVDKLPSTTPQWLCASSELAKLSTGTFEIDLTWEPIAVDASVSSTNSRRDLAATRDAVTGSRAALQRCFGAYESYVTLTIDVARDGGTRLVRGEGESARVACAAKVLAKLPAGEPDRVVIALHRLNDATTALASALYGDDSSHMSRRRPSVDNLGAQIADIRQAGGAQVPPPTGPTGRISVVDKRAFDDTTLVADIVLAKVLSAYVAGVKRCYKQLLAKDPSARGRITIALTVNAAGRAVNGSASSFDESVDACITAQVMAWRFPIPKDHNGDPTEASFRIVLQAAPD